MVDQGAGARVGEDHRRLRDVEDLAHHVRRDVREVDQHAQPVHLAHHLAAERREPAVRRRVGRRVGPVGVPAVGERHVAHAELVVGAQRAEAVLDRLAALHAQERGDLALLPGALDVGGAGGEEERVRDRRRSSGARGRSARAGCAPGSAVPTGCRRSRTGRRPGPRAGAGCRCRPSRRACAGRPATDRSRTSRAASRAGRCGRRRAPPGPGARAPSPARHPRRRAGSSGRTRW